MNSIFFYRDDCSAEVEHAGVETATGSMPTQRCAGKPWPSDGIWILMNAPGRASVL